MTKDELSKSVKREGKPLIAGLLLIAFVLIVSEAVDFALDDATCEPDCTAIFEAFE